MPLTSPYVPSNIVETTRIKTRNNVHVRHYMNEALPLQNNNYRNVCSYGLRLRYTVIPND